MTNPTAPLLTESEVEKLSRLAGNGSLQFPLRVEHWHKSLTDGGWYIRQSSGRIVMTVAFVPAEIESGIPARDGNAPARTTVALLNAVPALIRDRRALSEMVYVPKILPDDEPLTYRDEAERLLRQNAALREQLAQAVVLTEEETKELISYHHREAEKAITRRGDTAQQKIHFDRLAIFLKR